MKHPYLPLAAICALTMQAAPSMPKQLAGETQKSSRNSVMKERLTKAPQRVTVEEIFAAPDNTVLDGPYLPDQGGFSGFQNSDWGRPGMPTRFYQAFHGCYKTVNAVRVIGLFNYCNMDTYEWFSCDGRGGMQADYTLTEPITFEVTFYKEAEDGTPGEIVYRKNIDILGRYLGVNYVNNEDKMPLYEFYADLDEEIKLECGFMSFCAADLGDSPSCWFSLFTADTSIDFSMMDMGDYGLTYAAMPCVFSFMGNGEWAAKKSLRVDHVSSPTENASGTHEKVIANLVNVGSDDITDATLELWVDNKFMSKETISTTIPSGGCYNYTFLQRLDLSGEGEHLIEVKNVTPDNEDISRNIANTSTNKIAEGEYCESYSIYYDDIAYISHVNIGTIDNQSSESRYTDYSEEYITDIHAGETLTLSAEPLEVAVIGVWVDWNGNGILSDPGEYMGYIFDSPLEIKIPEGNSVSEGVKRMRLVMDSYNNPQPCGKYYFGETEDYGINIVRHENTPEIYASISEISEISDNREIKEVNFEIANEGSDILETTININYSLPIVYDPNILAPAREFPDKVKVKESFSTMNNATPGTDIQHVLRYDRGFELSIGIGNYDSAMFAQYYPTDVMSSIKGMKISSMDVFFSDVPESAIVKIFEESSFGKSGDLIAEQEFTPTADGWNHIEFEKPVDISGKGIFYGVEIKNMVDGKYYLGVDGLPAISGYGELINIGGDTWWSMTDLGVDHNFCIRANVIGERTDAINWLSIDKNSADLAAGEKVGITAFLNSKKLNTGVYEASIEISSNDELCPAVSIPVYLTNGIATSIDTTKLGKTAVKIENGNIVISSEDNILNVTAFDMNGSKVASKGIGRTKLISLDNFANGIYLLNVAYCDGSHESFKIAVAR